MQRFAEKLKAARAEADLSQAALAEQVDVSIRSISAYETGMAIPRGSTMRKLAHALAVSLEYLTNDEVTDPKAGMAKEIVLEDIRGRYGSKGVAEADMLLQRNRALFAGGVLTQDAKDAFFQAVMTAYVTCKEEAKETFGHKKDEE